jgi:hypothetical protein
LAAGAAQHKQKSTLYQLAAETAQQQSFSTVTHVLHFGIGKNPMAVF